MEADAISSASAAVGVRSVGGSPRFVHMCAIFGHRSKGRRRGQLVGEMPNMCTLKRNVKHCMSAHSDATHHDAGETK